jgi:hypothetical protein
MQLVTVTMPHSVLRDLSNLSLQQSTRSHTSYSAPFVPPKMLDLLFVFLAHSLTLFLRSFYGTGTNLSPLAASLGAVFDKYTSKSA